jgi:hypothetical protein
MGPPPPSRKLTFVVEGKEFALEACTLEGKDNIMKLVKRVSNNTIVKLNFFPLYGPKV